MRKQPLAQYRLPEGDAAPTFTKEHAYDLSGQGCLRRAFYAVTGHPSNPSTSDLLNDRRDELLKETAVSEYRRQSKRLVRIAEYQKHKEFPWIGSLVDFMEFDKTGRQGYRREGWRAVLEVHVVSASIYRSMKASPQQNQPVKDLAAVQWGMWINDIKHGELWVWSPEAMDGIVFDVPFDPFTHDEFEKNARDVRWVKDHAVGPERIPDGGECARCQFRAICKPKHPAANW